MVDTSGPPADTGLPPSMAATFRDSSRCPLCAASIVSPRCGACGADLSTATGSRLWQLSWRVADLIDQRGQLLEQLRAEREAARLAARRAEKTFSDAAAHAAQAPTPAPVAAALSPIPATPLPPPLPTPLPTPPAPLAPQASAPATRRDGTPRTRLGVQSILIGTGALLIAVAGLVFLFFAWALLNLTGRAAIVAGITAIAMASAAWWRPRLPQTGQALGWVAATLVLADVWAARATGLLPPEAISTRGFLCLGMLGGGGLLLAWGWAARLKAGTLAGVTLLPFGLMMLGFWAGGEIGYRQLTFALTSCGMIGAALLGLVRWPADWRHERFVQSVTTRLMWIGVPLSAPVWLILDANPLTVCATQALAFGAAVLLSRHHRPEKASTATSSQPPRMWWEWSTAAGISAALVGVPLWLPFIKQWGPEDRAAYAGLPISAAAGALVLWLLVGRGRPAATLLPVFPRLALRGARAVAVALTVPAAIALLNTVSDLTVGASQRWLTSAGRPRAVIDSTLAGDPTALRYAALGLLGTGALILLTTPVRWAPPAVGLVLGGLVLGALDLDLPIWLSVLLLLAVVAGTIAAHRVTPIHESTMAALRFDTRQVLMAGGILAGLIAVFLSWTAPELTVPVTLLGAIGLVALALEAAPVVRAALLAAAAATPPIVAAVVPEIYFPATPWGWFDLRPFAITAALITVICYLSPRRLPGTADPGERELLGLLGLGLTCLPAAWAVLNVFENMTRFAVPTDERLPWPGLLPLIALAPATAAMLTRVVDHRSPSALRNPLSYNLSHVVGAALLPPLTFTAVALIAMNQSDWFGDGGALRITAVVVLGMAVAVVALERWHDATPGDLLPEHRFTAAAVSTLALITLGGLLALFEQDSVLFTLFGAAAASLAMRAGWARVAWAGWLMLSAANLIRLRQNDVGVIEAYTVPPALALLALAVFIYARGGAGRDDDPAAPATRGGGRTTMFELVVPGLGLLIVPSVLAARTGPLLRPTLLLVIGSAAVVLGLLPYLLRSSAGSDRRPAGPLAEVVDRLRAPVVLAGLAAVLGTAAVRWLRSLGLAEPGWRDLEVWTLPAAAMLLLAGIAWLRRNPGSDSWLTLGPACLLALLPGMLAVLDGAPIWRAVLVSGLAALILVAGVLTHTQAPLLIGAAGLTLHAGIRWTLAAGLPDPGWRDLEAWTLPTAAMLLLAGIAWLRRNPGSDSWLTLGPACLLALLPGMLAVLDGEPIWRAVLVTCLAALALATGLLTRTRAPMMIGAAGLILHSGIRVMLAAALPDPGWRDLEAWTLPAAAMLLLAGVVWLRRHPETGSWSTLAPGTVLALFPGLFAVLDGVPPWRAVLVTCLGGLILAGGAVTRTQAPVMIGAGVLALHAVVQLGPEVARVVAGQPRWLVLAVVGAALLTMGATYERRLRELRSVRSRLMALR